MAKWSDKPIGAMGSTTCPHCNAAYGQQHNKFCPTQLSIDPNWPYKVSVREDERICENCGNGSCECAAPDNSRLDADNWHNVIVKKGYFPLFQVLNDALNQAQVGKGHERHADGQPFTDQPVLTITRAVGLGFPLGQAMKKIQECQRMDTDAAQRELLGAINYLAAAVLFLDE
jgi:hypothetical protein